MSKVKARRKVIEGWTSNQEVRASIWVSEGEEIVYQFACNLYKSEKIAKKIYGKNAYRKVKIILQELPKPKGRIR